MSGALDRRGRPHSGHNDDEQLAHRNTDAPEVVETRLRNAPGELAEWREYEYLVMNDDLEQATARLVAIVDAERARVKRLTPSS